MTDHYLFLLATRRRAIQLVLGLGLALYGPAALAQNAVGIGTTAPDPKAALDIQAADKGLLIPRLDSAQRVALGTPPDGLMVFQKNGRVGLWYAFGGQWFYIPDKLRSGDNLGNHTATQNLNLTDKLLVGGTAAAPGTSGLRVTQAGRVGIGSTAPFSQLANTPANILGSDGNGGNAGSLTWAASQNGYVGMFYNAQTTGPANGLAVKVDGTTNVTALDVSKGGQTTPGASLLTVRASGYVGVGLATPSGRLHVVNDNGGGGSADDYLFDEYGPAGDQRLYLRRARGTRAQPLNLQGGELIGGIGFGARVNNIQQYISSGINAYYTGDSTTNASDLRLTTSGAERLRITDTGNVGIGVANPTFKVEVGGSVFTRGENFGFIPDVNGLARVGLIKYQGREGGIWRLNNQDFEVGRVSNATTPLTALPATPALPDTWTTDLYVGSGGYFALGTNTPNGRFHSVTRATGYDDDYLFDQYSATGDQRIYFRRFRGTPAAPLNVQAGDMLGGVSFGGRINGATQYNPTSINAYYLGDSTTTATDLRINTSGAERLRISEVGNVGVGTNAPPPSSTSTARPASGRSATAPPRAWSPWMPAATWRPPAACPPAPPATISATTSPPRPCSSTTSG